MNELIRQLIAKHGLDGFLQEYVAPVCRENCREKASNPGIYWIAAARIFEDFRRVIDFACLITGSPKDP